MLPRIDATSGTVAAGAPVRHAGPQGDDPRTYGLSLIGVAILFGFAQLTAWTQTYCWMAIFFVASAAASSAYLTASEIFPLETRAMAIALFYAIGTLIGGVTVPYIFGHPCDVSGVTFQAGQPTELTP